MNIKNYLQLVIYLLFPLSALCQQLPPTYPTLVRFREADIWGLRPAIWGYRDSTGQTIIKPQYNYAYPFMGPYAVVSTQEGFGAIDKKNRIIIPFKYHILNYLGNERFSFGYRAKYFGEYKMGLMAVDGSILISPIYDYVSVSGKNYEVSIERDSLIMEGEFRGARSIKTSYGLFDASGRELLPCQYDYINRLDDSLLVVQVKRKYILYSVLGQALTSAPYTYIGEFHEGLAMVRENRLIGFINKKGQTVIPVKMEVDIYEPFSRGLALIMVKQKWGAINKKGQIVIQPTHSYEEIKEKVKRVD